MTITTDLGTDLSRDNRNNTSLHAATVAAVVTGGWLAAYGLSRRNWTGLGLAAGGAYILYRGISRGGHHVGSVRVAYTINRSPEDLYNLVRDEETWPQLGHGIQVTREGDDLKVVLGRPLGFEIASTVRITDEDRGKYMAWSSLPGAIEHRGVMHFRPAPGNRGTEVAVSLEYKVPGGALTRGVAMLRGKGPEQRLRESLRRLKQLAEAGEIPTTLGQPSGARGAKGSALRVLYREPVHESANRGERQAS